MTIKHQNGAAKQSEQDILPLQNSAVKILIDSITLRNLTHLQQQGCVDSEVRLEFPCLPFRSDLDEALAALPVLSRPVLHLHSLEK